MSALQSPAICGASDCCSQSCSIGIRFCLTVDPLGQVSQAQAVDRWVRYALGLTSSCHPTHCILRYAAHIAGSIAKIGQRKCTLTWCVCVGTGGVSRVIRRWADLPLLCIQCTCTIMHVQCQPLLTNLLSSWYMTVLFRALPRILTATATAPNCYHCTCTRCAYRRGSTSP